jgi:RNA polymerase sigma-70 factor (ECF subfamily)
VRDEDFTLLHREYSGRLFGYIRWITGNAPESQDILQTVLIKAWRHQGGPADPPDRTRWLYAVARNACTDYFRSANRRRRLCDRLSREFEEEEAPADTRIWELLRRLDETDRSILYLHLKAGYSHAEIGAMLRMAENAVRVRAFRALRRLREFLNRQKPG